MYFKKSLVMKLTDVVDIIKTMIGSHGDEKAEDIIFTETEMEYCGKRLHCLGARYVIKKCVIDYLAKEKGYVENSYREIEVVNNELGQPLLRLYNGVRECMNDLKIKDTFISISHSRNWIAGMVIFSY